MEEDRKRNEYVNCKDCKKKNIVVSTVRKIRENKLRWFGYVFRREKSEDVRMVIIMYDERKIGG